MVTSWDINAEKRHKQIIDGQDISFKDILAPTTIRLVKEIKGHERMRAIDIGCGTGVLTFQLSKQLKEVEGIDSSRASIKLAEKYFKNQAKVFFNFNSIESYSVKKKKHLAISNMTFHTIKNVNNVLISISRLLTKHGILIFSIPHPCFWVEYRRNIGQDDYLDYFYKRNSFHKIRFSISEDRTPLPGLVPYFHRPLEYYSRCLMNNGFQITQLLDGHRLCMA